MIDSFPDKEQVRFVLIELLDKYLEKIFYGIKGVDCDIVTSIYDKVDTFLEFTETRLDEFSKGVFYYDNLQNKKDFIVLFLVYVFQFPEYQDLNTVKFHKRMFRLFSKSNYNCHPWRHLCQHVFSLAVRNEIVQHCDKELVDFFNYDGNYFDHPLWFVKLTAEFLSYINTKYPCDMLFLNQGMELFNLMSDRERIIPMFKQWCFTRYPEGISQWM